MHVQVHIDRHEIIDNMKSLSSVALDFQIELGHVQPEGRTIIAVLSVHTVVVQSYHYLVI